MKNTFVHPLCHSALVVQMGKTYFEPLRHKVAKFQKKYVLLSLRSLRLGVKYDEGFEMPGRSQPNLFLINSQNSLQKYVCSVGHIN